MTKPDASLQAGHHLATIPCTPLPYKVKRHAGSGGFALVYHAVQTNSKTPHASPNTPPDVALKVFRSEFNGHQNERQDEEMMLSEALCLQSLKHPNIVQCYSVCKIPQSTAGLKKMTHPEQALTMVMEFCEVGSLTRLIYQEMMDPHRKRFSDTDALYLLLDVARGLHYMHSQTPIIAHRDVKQENVLLTKQGGGRLRAKLADLGLHVVLDPRCKESILQAREHNDKSDTATTDQSPSTHTAQTHMNGTSPPLNEVRTHSPVQESTPERARRLFFSPIDAEFLGKQQKQFSSSGRFPSSRFGDLLSVAPRVHSESIKLNVQEQRPSLELELSIPGTLVQGGSSKASITLPPIHAHRNRPPTHLPSVFATANNQPSPLSATVINDVGGPASKGAEVLHSLRSIGHTPLHSTLSGGGSVSLNPMISHNGAAARTSFESRPAITKKKMSAGMSAEAASVRQAMSPEFQRVFQLTGETGSHTYMSPEVYKHELYNQSADVYSFGILLYEVMTRTMLILTHIGRQVTGLKGVLHTTDDYAKAASLGFRPERTREFSDELWVLVTACWDQDPIKRPSMGLVVARLENLIASEASNKQGGATTTPADDDTASCCC